MIPEILATARQGPRGLRPSVARCYWREQFSETKHMRLMPKTIIFCLLLTAGRLKRHRKRRYLTVSSQI